LEYIERHPEDYKQIEIDVAIYYPWKSGKQIWILNKTYPLSIW
jgi:hypothetical protein